MEYNKHIELFRNKDESVFSEIYHNYSSALFGVIYRIVKDEEMANDILQEAFIKIWNNADKYDPSKSRLYTWMHRICRNTTLNYISKKAEKLKTFSMHGSKEAFSKSIQNFNPDVIDIGINVKGLNDHQKEIIEYLYFKGHTQQEVSDILNIPLGTVKSRTRSALKALKNIYQNDSKIKPSRTLLSIAKLISFLF